MVTSLRVLILQGPSAGAAAIIDQLRRAGFEPEWTLARNRRDFELALDHQAFDLVLADTRVPDLDAPQALSALQSRALEVPVIVLAGAIDDATAAGALKAGACDVFQRDQLGRLGPAIDRELKARAERHRHRLERAGAEQALRDQTNLYQALLDAQSDLGQILILTDGDRPIFINGAFAQVTGYHTAELMAMRSLFELVPPEERDRLPIDLMERLDGQQTRTFETVISAKDGRRIHLEGTDMRFESGGRPLVLTLARDVTTRKLAEQELRRQSLEDPLTGLANRRRLREDMERLLCRDPSEPFSVLLLNLDHFREVNDTFGHRLGDRLLQQVGPRLQRMLGPDHVIARLGDDTFAVVIPGATRTDAQGVAQLVLEAMDQPFEVEGHALDLGASLGTATAPQDGTAADELLRRAEIALSHAKRSRGISIAYRPAQEPQSNRLALMAQLRRAIQHQDLRLYVQPIVGLTSEQVIGFETLVRWAHPERGLIPPIEFIPFAERTRLIRPLTRWVLAHALRTQCALRDAGHQLRVGVNVSMRDLMDPALPKDVEELLAESGARADGLMLELTEGVIMADPERTVAVLSRVRALGVDLAVDDFGTGYSSLAILNRLPVDTIKIDKSLSANVVREPSKAKIVRASIELSHALGLQVIGEGVEDRATWDLLAALGCDAVQGYLISRPIPADEAVAWLGSWRRPRDRGLAA